jgi:hypothetical protein
MLTRRITTPIGTRSASTTLACVNTRTRDHRHRVYRYVGPAEILAAAQASGAGNGHRIQSMADLAGWVAARPPADLAEPFTFVIDVDGALWLAPRRSEHVACAHGEAVRSAGEIGFTHAASRWVVSAVSNQSTGYCPDVVSWPAVAEALSRIGIEHPAGFTAEVVFRRCPDCQERGVVREDDFVCVFCGGELPQQWNVDPYATDSADAGS